MTQTKAPTGRSTGARGQKDHADKPMSGGVATINHVARLAEVSIKTVSRVMNKEPNVREETRAKVMDAVKRLQYQPNLLARSLAGSRSFLIGLLHDNPVPSYIYDCEMGAIARCRANRSRYHVLSEPLNSKGDLQGEIAEFLATIRLDGVILTPPLCDMTEVLRAVEAAGVPYVRIAPSRELERSARVHMDDVSAAAEITQYLIDRGHRDIGFIFGDLAHGASELRHQGYVQAMRGAGIEPRPEWVKRGEFTFKSGQAAADAMLSGSHKPTAIFAANDEMAFGVMAAAQEKKINVPDDLSVVGFDDNPGAQLIWPHLTTIHQPVREMAADAAGLLLERDDDVAAPADFHTRAKQQKYALVERDSVKDLRSRA